MADIEYVVRWEMPVTSSSPEEAARFARQIMRDPESIATYFEVFPGEPAEHDPIIVDLPVKDDF